MPKKFFTTGQVAKICDVAPRTVSKWVDSGKLRGYRLPSSLDRRIPKESLVSFLQEQGFPLGDLEEERLSCLLFTGGTCESYDLPPEIKVECVADAFDAGVRFGLQDPRCVVIDFAMGFHQAMEIARSLHESYSRVVLIALLGTENNGFSSELFTEVFRKPFDTLLLTERITTLTRRHVHS